MSSSSQSSASAAQLAYILQTVLADNEILSKELAAARARYELAEQTFALNPPHTSVTATGDVPSLTSTCPRPTTVGINLDSQSHRATHVEAEEATREATKSRLRATSVSEACSDLDRSSQDFEQASQSCLSDTCSYRSLRSAECALLAARIAGAQTCSLTDLAPLELHPIIPPSPPPPTYFGIPFPSTPRSSQTLSFLPPLWRRVVPVAPKRDTSYSDTLHPTFSSWIKNMNALSTLINRLSDLATTAPQEHRPQLNRQVAALRAGFKKQQERCIAFLQLTNEYADRFLTDISDEIQQQSSFLDALEKRLDMAKTLRQEAIQMRKSYEDGTLDCIKKVRRTVLSEPLPEDVDLFREMDIVLIQIRQCYTEMDKFWVDEVQRVTKSLKNRRVDPEDIDRWRDFRESLEHSIAHWERSPTNDEVAPRPKPRLPIHDLGRIVSSLSDVSNATQRILRSVRLCASAEVEFVKPVHYSLILQGEVKFSENRASCFEFLEGCVRYGKTVVMVCMAFVSYSPFSRTRTSQDLVERATRLGTERIDVSAEGAVRMQDMRKFNSIHKKCLASLRKMDHGLNTLLNCISAWVTELDAYSTFPAFNIKHLQGLCRIWVKNRDAMGHVLGVLPLFDDGNRYLPSMETHA